MKKLQNNIAVLTIITALMVSSCTTDPCKDTSCSGNGTTVPSADNKSCSCNCQSGYVGANCNQVDLTKLVGTYEAKDIDSRSKEEKYDVTITVTGNSLLINNFANVFSSNVVIANIDGTNMSITSPTDVRGQNPNINLGYYVKTTENGKISFVNGVPVIKFTYQGTSPSGTLSTFNCTYTKK